MGICGHGECVLTSASPFYECKCKEPFQPPNCRRRKENVHNLCTSLGFSLIFLCFFLGSLRLWAKPLQERRQVHHGWKQLWLCLSWGVQRTFLPRWWGLFIDYFFPNHEDASVIHVLDGCGQSLRSKWLLLGWWGVVSWECEWDGRWRRLPALELPLHPGPRRQSLQILWGQRWTRTS